MSSVSFGTPSDDARCMLYGMRDKLQEHRPMHTMAENCSIQNVIIDQGTTKVIWTSSITTAVVLTAVHLTRWFMSPSRNALSELLILLLAVTGVVVFLRDVYACKIQAGMCKLLLFLILSNVLIPWMFHQGSVAPLDVDVDEDEVPF